jgi:hypothetical protein
LQEKQKEMVIHPQAPASAAGARLGTAGAGFAFLIGRTVFSPPAPRSVPEPGCVSRRGLEFREGTRSLRRRGIQRLDAMLKILLLMLIISLLISATHSAKPITEPR